MKLIYSCGDVNGIGLEIFFKSISHFQDHENILVCNNKTLEEYYFKLYGKEIENKESFYKIDDNSQFKLEPLSSYSEVNFGKIKEDAGILSAKSILRSLDLINKNKNSAFVTLPINKASISLSGWKFQGHTEMIADHYATKDFNMILTNGKLNLIPLTIHIPLNKVHKTINKELIFTKFKAFEKSLKYDFGIANPKIAFLSLNPHAGDKGRIGYEEMELIEPAINDLAKDHLAFGPFAADSFFAFKKYNSYNGVISMYHDQGLIPIKMLSNGGGVNFTSGLPIVRTSPDHGTAYELAGKNISDEKSLKEAISIAIKIKRNRDSDR
jgi:4-hydroxythreonine-4-phosphate dehydrogenase